MPGRAIFSNFIQKIKEGKKQPKVCPFYCIKTCDISKSPYCIITALYNAFRGNMENGYAFAGANAFKATKIMSVKETFRSFILEERAKEFAVEGNRRTDLIRWGIYLSVMNAIGMDENGNLKRREEKHWLMPLPPDEINGNPYIEKNNPGW